MTKYYCNCLNICITLKEGDNTLFRNQNQLSEEEREHEFFRKLPLMIVQFCEVHKQQSALIKSNTVGSWTCYKCLNCSLYSHSISNKENSTITLINSLLKKLDASDLREMKESIDFSPIFNVIVMDSSSYIDYSLPSQKAYEEFFNENVMELKKQLTEKIEEERRNVEEIIRKFSDQQDKVLKQYTKRANDDFQILKNAVLSNSMDVPKKKECLALSEIKSDIFAENTSVNLINPVINDNTTICSSHQKEKIAQSRDRNPSFSSTLPVSLDSEGLFPLEGMEENNVIEDEEHSEDDLSDTDDSGSRDEGIHIPRRKSVAIARSLPIRVRADFDLSLRLFDERLDDNKGKQNYKHKPRNERPLDIAASMKALANSVHGDTVFGDLPPPRIGSRI